MNKKQAKKMLADEAYALAFFRKRIEARAQATGTDYSLTLKLFECAVQGKPVEEMKTLLDAGAKYGDVIHLITEFTTYTLDYKTKALAGQLTDSDMSRLITQNHLNILDIVTRLRDAQVPTAATPVRPHPARKSARRNKKAAP